MSRRGDRVEGYRSYGGLLIVPCVLNSTYRYWFLVDTGAAFTALSRRVAAEMKIALSSPLRHERIASVHQTVRIPVVRLDSLQIGSQYAMQIEALVLSFPTTLRIDGLLGVNFLGKFRITIEFDRRTLVLR